MERSTEDRLIWLLGLVFTTCLFLFVLPMPSHAQITFERTYGGTEVDAGYSVQQTLDGGYIITGCVDCWRDSADVYLVKTDSLGNTLWARTYGGSYYDGGSSVQQTLDGGYLIAGNTYSFGAGESDIYLIRTDSLGNMLWDTTYGGADFDVGASAQQTPDRGYIVAGFTYSFGAGGADVYVIRTDSLGYVRWDSTYGGSSHDYGSSVRRTLDGGYVIAGQTESFSAGSTDVYLIKTDSLGNTLWQTTYGGADRDAGASVQQTLDGGYVIAGDTRSFGAGDWDVCLIKTDFLGAEVWTKTYGDSSYDWGSSIQQTFDGGYVIAGGTWSFGAGESDVYMIKTDSLENTLWARTYGGPLSDYGYSIQQTLDGGYIMVGQTRSFGAGLYDIYLIKTDENGLLGIQEKSEELYAKGSRPVLSQNIPNPFHTRTVISYSLPATTKVTLEAYDVAGRLVETLVSETQGPGLYQVCWDRKDNRSGVYFYRLQAGEFTYTKKMVLLR